jgi:hypothetical protein
MEQRAGIIEKDIGNAQINQAMGTSFHSRTFRKS